MYRYSQNSFSKGMNKDLDERVLQSESYRDAVNFTLTNEGEFFSLTKVHSSGEDINLNLSSEFLGVEVTSLAVSYTHLTLPTIYSV